MGERGAHRAVHVESQSEVVPGARLARSVVLPAETQGRCYRTSGGHTFIGQVDKASITEAPSIKIGIDQSSSRVALGPILATLGIRALLAPNFRSRLTCSKRPI